MEPCFIIIIGSEEHDYTRHVSDDGLSVVREDIDADGAGRNLLDGKMYRSLITRKYKLTVKFLAIPQTVVQALSADLASGEFVFVKFLDPNTGSYTTKGMYTSAFTFGIQRYNRGAGRTMYEGCTFNLIER